jgi:hypothetical protein
MVRIFRHSFATPLFLSGAGTRKMEEILGHKDLKNAMVYTHVAGMGAEVKSPLGSLDISEPVSISQQVSPLTAKKQKPLIKAITSKPKVVILLIICVLFIAYGVINEITKPILADDVFAFSPASENGQLGVLKVFIITEHQVCLKY